MSDGLQFPEHGPSPGQQPPQPPRDVPPAAPPHSGEPVAGRPSPAPAHGAAGRGLPYGSAPVPLPGDIEVVGRRVVQYILDSVLSSILPWVSLLLFLLVPVAPDGSVAAPGLAVPVGLLVVVLWVVLYVGYWVFLPAKSNGQTPGMKMLGVRVVRIDGRQPSMGQHFVRWVLLIVDGVWAGLVGLIVILVSDRRQRVGDLAAKTLVVRR